MITVNCETIRDDLCFKAKNLALQLLTQIMETTTQKMEAIQKQYEDIEAVLLG